jgi:cytochrome c oxidase assembly factor CtaG
VYASFEAVVLVPVLAVGYLLWTRRPTQAQAVAAAAALILLFAFFVSPIQEWATHTFLWAHLLQNVVLAEWAPLLLVLAVPHEKAKRIRVPMLPALALWLITYFVWHLPYIYDVALHHQHWLLHIEHLTYLIAGLGLWWPVVHGDASPGAKAAYLAAAFVLASPIGLLLALIPRAIYPFYSHASRPGWGPSPLADQQIAGVTMALEQAVVFFAAFAYFLHRFLQEESRDPEAFSAQRRNQGAVRRT